MSNTQNQKHRRAERARAFLEQLIDRYPAVFSRQRDKVRPLAIGIQEALRKNLDRDEELANTPNWVLKQALARYTRSSAYLESIIAGYQRLALDGSESGEVTDEAIKHARARREEQKKRTAERRRQRQPRQQKPASEAVRERKLDALAAKFNNR